MRNSAPYVSNCVIMATPRSTQWFSSCADGSCMNNKKLVE
jgi:hypothetical protein